MPPLDAPARIAMLLSPLLFAALLILIALAAGGRWATRLGERRDDALCWLALALPLGLGLVAQALFLWGVAGRFGAGAMALVAALALRLGWRELAAAWYDVVAFFGGAGDWSGKRRARRFAHAALGALALTGPAWLALYPPLAWDDTIYHLPLARSLLEQGRYVFVGNLRAPVFPLLAETLFAPALFLGRASTAHGVSLVATLATMLLLLVWGRERCAGAERSTASVAWTLAPAALWIGQPIVVLYAGSSFVEPLLTLFATAAAFAFERWRRDRAPSWLLAAGAFAGWAAATKYLGLYLVGALALAVLWEAGRGTRRRALAYFAGAAVLVAGPWYALIWVLAGNPLFPFLPAIFGGGAWSGAAAAGQSAKELGWVRGGLDILRLGWDLVVSRARLNAQPPASPIVVAALPLLLYAGWRRRASRLWIGILGGFVVVFLALPRDARYLMFLSPLLALLLVAALADLAAAAAARGAGLAVALVILGLAPGPAYAAWRAWICGPPPVDAAGTDAFLARRVPLYRTLLFRRAHGLDHVPLYALHGERLHDFGGTALLGDWTGPFRYELVLPLLDRPEALARRLRNLGAAELVLPRALVSPAIVDGVAASPRFFVLYRDDEGVLLALLAPGGD